MGPQDRLHIAETMRVLDLSSPTQGYPLLMPKKEVLDAVRRRRDFKALFHPFSLEPGGWSSCASMAGLTWQSVRFDDSVPQLLPGDEPGPLADYQKLMANPGAKLPC